MSFLDPNKIHFFSNFATFKGTHITFKVCQIVKFSKFVLKTGDFFINVFDKGHDVGEKKTTKMMMQNF